MKHLLLILTALICTLPSLAQLNGDGYYRVQNFKTGRYIYVVDDKGRLDYQSTTADMGAITLWKGFEKACSDPGTVCYIVNHGDRNHDISAQGTGIHEIIDSYVKIRKVDNQDAYYAYGSKEGVTKYLCDAEQANIDKGALGDAGKGDYRKWYIKPIGTSNDNFFGVKPSLNVNGTYYASYFTEFPYSFASSDMKAFYVYKIEKGYAVIKEIKGTIPGNTPLYLKVNTDSPIDNKLNIGGNASSIKDNVMKGVFFMNKTGDSHENVTPYDAQRMRILGTKKDGTLGFITSNIKYIPANSSYVPVTVGTPDELTIITEEEYEKLNSKKPESITISETNITIVEGNNHQLNATVLPEDAFNKSVTWSSGNSSIATVDNNGIVTGVKAGTTTVTATTCNGLTANCEVIVKEPIQPESVILSETLVNMLVGETHKLTATVTPDNAYNKSVTWGSYDVSKATIDQNGIISAHGVGIVRVFAESVNGIKSICEVVIKEPVEPNGIILSEDKVNMFIGEKHKLTATVTPEDAYDKRVYWGSNDQKLATIDDDGVISAIREGVVRVQARTVNDIIAYCEVVITKEVKPIDIKIDPKKTTLNVGEKIQLKATVFPENASNKSVTWSVDNDNIAKVDNDGFVTAISSGNAIVTATSSNGLKANCYITVENPDILATSITLDKNTYEAVEGSEFILKATILPEDATVKNVEWNSSDNESATVKDGVVKVLKESKVIISVATTDGSNLKDECIVTVLSGIEEIFADVNEFPVKIYTSNGMFVKTAYSTKDFKSLSPGMYIIGGKKVVLTK